LPSADYLSIRSVIETPVMEDRMWAKVPTIPADAVLVDMEDALPASRKVEGRARAEEILRTPEIFRGRLAIARPNHLSTPWGRDDVLAIARANPRCVMYPKVRSTGEVREVQRMLREHGCDPDIIVCIETPQAVTEVEAFGSIDRVVGLVFGEGDLSAEMGITSRHADGSLNVALLQPRFRTIMAAHAAGLAALDAAFVPNIRDVEAHRRQCEELVSYGVTGLIAIYPPQVEIHLELLTPSSNDVAWARDVVDVFEAAVNDAHPAMQLADGRTVLIHDYLKAQRVLTRSEKYAAT
jgi:citrate lyase beta subunit